MHYGTELVLNKYFSCLYNGHTWVFGITYDLSMVLWMKINSSVKKRLKKGGKIPKKILHETINIFRVKKHFSNNAWQTV